MKKIPLLLIVAFSFSMISAQQSIRPLPEVDLPELQDRRKGLFLPYQTPVMELGINNGVTMVASQQNGGVENEHFFDDFESGVTNCTVSGSWEIRPPIVGPDNSGSISEEIVAVRNNLFNFLDRLENPRVNFALGLTRYGASQNAGFPIFKHYLIDHLNI